MVSLGCGTRGGVSVNNTTASGGKIHAAVNARVARHVIDPAVLMRVVVEAQPRRPVVVGTKERLNIAHLAREIQRGPIPTRCGLSETERIGLVDHAQFRERAPRVCGTVEAVVAKRDPKDAFTSGRRVHLAARAAAAAETTGELLCLWQFRRSCHE